MKAFVHVAGGFFLMLTISFAEIRITNLERDGTLTWTNSVSQATYLVERSSDLVAWVNQTNVNSTELINTAVVPLTAPAIFYRIRRTDSGLEFSVNAVGAVTSTLRKGYNLVGNPLVKGGNTVNEILPQSVDLPSDTFITTWNSSLGTTGGPDTDVPSFYPGIGWYPAGPVLPPGRGFYLYIPNDAANDIYQVILVGEVLQNPCSAPVAKHGRFGGLASPFPMAGRITTDLHFEPANDDIVLVWDKNAGVFGSTVYTYIEGIGWNDGSNAVEPVIGLGDGFFLFRVQPAPNRWCFGTMTGP